MNELMNTSEQGFTSEQLEMLDAPLDASLIKQRPDGKKYLKGSTEFDHANRVFGYGRWGYKVISRTLQKVYDLDDKVVGLYFYVEVELYVAGAMFPFHGDGGQSVVQYNAQGYENAAKGATTDAVKRALRHYGDQFGLCLYDEDSLVDVGDGVLTTVKQYNPKHQQGSQKRIVEAQNNAPKQIHAPVSTQQTTVAQQENKPLSLKEYFAIVYKHALALKQFSFSETAGDKEKMQAFLDFAGPVVGATLASAGHLTKSRLDDIEAYLNAKDAA